VDGIGAWQIEVNTMSKGRKFTIVSLAATLTLFVSLVSFYVPSLILRYGSEETASAKLLFRFDEASANKVETALHEFSKNHGLRMTIDRLDPLGPHAANISLNRSDIGEITINNTLQDGDYNCYFYGHGNTSDYRPLWRDFKQKFLDLGAKVIEEKTF
jgi:hypothetical protein